MKQSNAMLSVGKKSRFSWFIAHSIPFIGFFEWTQRSKNRFHSSCLSVSDSVSVSVSVSLTVYMGKTKVMVFRRGGFLGKEERWSLDDSILEVMNSYKYLGFVFTTKLSTTTAMDKLTVKAKKKVIRLQKRLCNLHTTNPRVFCECSTCRCSLHRCMDPNCGAWTGNQILKRHIYLPESVFYVST